MSRYLLKRLSMAAFTLYAVMTITFVMIQSIPGGPEDTSALSSCKVAATAPSAWHRSASSPSAR